ncbi:unnamed protein product [Linum tenue]|uniref:F-box domain-containing protein n=1 Tax=Linum tenue TaxID=586396 RepID=A0AAV0NIE7_9ROSI|nr:unnamed protein product [Linum tenue]
MKPVRRSIADRISDLPANVIELILMSLPIRDAGKSSILSSKWRHRWRSIPQLVFDFDFNTYDDERELMLNISKALLVHDGPITKFVLAMPGINPCQELDPVILHVSSKGVREFALYFSDEVIQPGYRQNIHSSLFSVLPLNCLKLWNCEFVPPFGFVGFGKLTRLELRTVTVPNYFYHDFLRKCPLLQDLRLLDCEGPTHVQIDEAPCLRVFLYNRGYLEDISFSRTPLLSVVSIQLQPGDFKLNEFDEARDVIAVFASLAALQKLYVSFEFLKFLAAEDIPSKLPTALRRLRVLDVRSNSHTTYFLESKVLFCLLRSSPNLRRLTIQRQFGVEFPTRPSQPMFFEPDSVDHDAASELSDDNAEDHCCPSLEEVNMQCSEGSNFEQALLKFVLAEAPLLRRIIIKPKPGLDWEKCFKLLKEVTHCHRVSEEAEVIFMSYKKTVWSMKLADI